MSETHLPSHHYPPNHARNQEKNQSAPRATAFFWIQNRARHAARVYPSRLVCYDHHSRILARLHCRLQSMIVSFELVDERTALVSMMEAARGVETLKQAHLCRTSTILVCGQLYFDSFSNEVLVTRITGSDHDKLALLAAHRFWRQFSVAFSSAT